MNLSKLFDMQRKLDDHIMDEHPELKGQDNLDWKILALQVELGECANEWRGFKKWKKNREPRKVVEVFCDECQGTGTPIGIPGESGVDCWKCKGTGSYFKNPLLEEYVDCLHFILSIGLELQFGNYPLIGNAPETRTVTHMFLITFEAISNFYKVWQLGNESLIEVKYTIVFNCFLTLGEMLGFTWEQVKQAYIEKNEINHQRQEAGY